jgi:hypothetical protein
LYRESSGIQANASGLAPADPHADRCRPAYEKGGYVIPSGQEDPRTVQRGHTLHHNIQAPVHLPTDSYFGYDQAFEAMRAQGGFSGYAHQGELFNGRASPTILVRRRWRALSAPFIRTEHAREPCVVRPATRASVNSEPSAVGPDSAIWTWSLL